MIQAWCKSKKTARLRAAMAERDARDTYRDDTFLIDIALRTDKRRHRPFIHPARVTARALSLDSRMFHRAIFQSARKPASVSKLISRAIFR
jgi:hypothetical protein